MKPIVDFNPYLPGTQQIIPTKEGGNGQIHQPGQYQNIIWQTRTRVPDKFETALIAALEEIFEQGVDELAVIIKQLNVKRLFDRNGAAWSEDSFRHFINIQGY